MSAMLRERLGCRAASVALLSSVESALRRRGGRARVRRAGSATTATRRPITTSAARRTSSSVGSVAAGRCSSDVADVDRFADAGVDLRPANHVEQSSVGSSRAPADHAMSARPSPPARSAHRCAVPDLNRARLGPLAATSSGRGSARPSGNSPTASPSAKACGGLVERGRGIARRRASTLMKPSLRATAAEQRRAEAHPTCRQQTQRASHPPAGEGQRAPRRRSWCGWR